MISIPVAVSHFTEHLSAAYESAVLCICDVGEQMRFALLAYSIPLSISVAGCSQSQMISLTAAPGQQAIHRNGYQSLVSNKAKLVMIRPSARSVREGSRPAFVIAIHNLGRSSQSILERQITASTVGQNNKRQALKVLTHAELVSEERSRQAVQAFAVALSGAAASMNAANAGYSTTTGSIRGYGPGGSTYGTFSAQSYDAGRAYAAQAHAQAQTASDFAALRAQGEQNLAVLENSILKDHTLMPGEWYGGVIVLDVPPTSSAGTASYTISVEFGGEVHEFMISQTRSS